MENLSFKYKLLFIIILSLHNLFMYSQLTSLPVVKHKNSKVDISYVKITRDETQVAISFNGGGWGKWVAIKSNTIIRTSNKFGPKTAKIIGLSDGTRMLSLNQQYNIPGNKTKYYLILIFEKLEPGCTTLDIIEPGGFKWTGVSINNPEAESPHYELSKDEIKSNILESDNGFCGIYENINTGLELACIKYKDEFKLVYYNSKKYSNLWRTADVKAELIPSSNPALFKVIWYDDDKRKIDDAYLIFENGTMRIYIDGVEDHYIKMYPPASIDNTKKGNKWSGTGFALLNGYIATNYHVIENAKTIIIRGVNGGKEVDYNANVVARDMLNDLAILKIEDNKFSGFGQIPYKIKTKTADVGENIFVLGYPLISTMGEDIKLTTGIISSKTGYQGDVSLYQISAPVQPGNSGGPLFDEKGEIIGIVNSKHTNAENVGYAIKTSYLNNLIESTMDSKILPENNLISTIDLKSKIKKVEKFVYVILCEN